MLQRTRHVEHVARNENGLKDRHVMEACKGRHVVRLVHVDLRLVVVRAQRRIQVHGAPFGGRYQQPALGTRELHKEVVRAIVVRVGSLRRARGQSSLATPRRREIERERERHLPRPRGRSTRWQTMPRPRRRRRQAPLAPRASCVARCPAWRRRPSARQARWIAQTHERNLVNVRDRRCVWRRARASGATCSTGT